MDAIFESTGINALHEVVGNWGLLGLILLMAWVAEKWLD
jgi:hypothetical protein